MLVRAGHTTQALVLGVVFALAAMVACPPSVQGSVIGDITIDVWNAAKTLHGTKTFSLDAVDSEAPVKTWEWDSQTTPTGLDIRDAAGTVLAHIQRIEVIVEQDPAVTVNFHLTNDTAGDMVFTVTPPALVSFAPIVNPQAYATASITLTDDDGTGGKIIGQFPGNTAYQARYNNDTVAWANLITANPLQADPDSSAIAVDRRPVSGRETINDTVSSIRAEYKFLLSANDSASGTSRFEVTPEPATLALMALGMAITLLGRRRAR